METPDVIYINSDGMIITKGDGDTKYHHSRIVEALRKERDDALKNYEIILNLYNKN